MPLDTHGFGMSSCVLFVELRIFINFREKNSEFYGTEDTILYAAAFDANGVCFDTLEGDAIISDSLNHASMIDGVRL
jgi:glycine C-acetyltransferase